MKRIPTSAAVAIARVPSAASTRESARSSGIASGSSERAIILSSRTIVVIFRCEGEKEYIRKGKEKMRGVELTSASSSVSVVIGIARTIVGSGAEICAHRSNCRTFVHSIRAIVDGYVDRKNKKTEKRKEEER